MQHCVVARHERWQWVVNVVVLKIDCTSAHCLLVEDLGVGTTHVTSMPSDRTAWQATGALQQLLGLNAVNRGSKEY
jgi:hypothetical protein